MTDQEPLEASLPRHERAPSPLVDRAFAYDLVLENAIVGVSYMRSRRFVWANSRMCEIFGYEPGELTGQSVRILYSTQEDYEEVGRMYATFARNNRYTHERALLRKDGQRIWCLIAGRMIDPVDPQSPSVWVVQDISDKKRAEDELRRANQRLEQRVEQRTVNLQRTNEALRLEIERRRFAELASNESREKYRTLFRTIPLGVLVTSALGEVVEINRTVQTYLGATTREQLLSLMDDQTRVIEGSDVTSLREFVRRQTAAIGRRILRFEIGWISRNGKRRDFAVVAAASSGHEFGATFAFADVTEQRLARERDHEQQQVLAHASRLSLVGQMASALAHELGQPLNACQSYVAGLQHRLAEEVAQRPDVLHAFDRISGHLDQAGDIIRNVRGFVSRHQPQFEVIEPATLVRQTLALLEVPLRGGSVRVVVDSAPQVPRVHCHPVEIQQVFVNLVMNAIDALQGIPPEQRSIHIRVGREARSYVAVHVSDSGPGVPAELAPRLFDPYFTTKETGLGMGLMICRTIVESHGGSIRLVPTMGRGADFRFTLPVARRP
jgi:PAS domain S-box-containing protein